MTPSEKAKELYKKFGGLEIKTPQMGFYGLVSGLEKIIQCNPDTAKQCALICVEEMYQCYKSMDAMHMMTYCEDVKAEIEKL